MNLKKALILAIGLTLFWVICIFDLRYHPKPDVRFLNDNYDRGIYYEHGMWIVDGKVPYRDIPSEYPQIPTYLFGFTFLALSWLQPMSEIGYWGWSAAFSLMMLGLLYLTIFALYKILPHHKNRAFLLLLPAYLYFTYNRFDILPTFICLLSLILLERKKYVGVSILLGIGTLTKWYPVLLMPIYLAYYWSLKKRINWHMIIAFGLTCFIIALPTLITGGMDALLVPYRFHMVRGLEKVSLPALIGNLIRPLLGDRVTIFQYVFLALEFILAPLCIFFKIDTFEKVLHWTILITTFFILFARTYSPQWVLWIIPPLILVSRTRWDLAWLVLAGIVTYLAFPVIADSHYSELALLGIAQIAFLVRTVITSFRRIKSKAGEIGFSACE